MRAVFDGCFKKGIRLWRLAGYSQLCRLLNCEFSLCALLSLDLREASLKQTSVALTDSLHEQIRIHVVCRFAHRCFDDVGILTRSRFRFD